MGIPNLARLQTFTSIAMFNFFPVVRRREEKAATVAARCRAECAQAVSASAVSGTVRWCGLYIGLGVRQEEGYYSSRRGAKKTRSRHVSRIINLLILPMAEPEKLSGSKHL
jgi:hypothetical protein